MRYMILIYDDEKRWLSMSDAEKGEMFSTHNAFTAETKRLGKYVVGNALQPSHTATTLRGKGATKPTVTDGPFAETKEQLGGFYVLDCQDLDEATAWASKLVEWKTGGIEIRPVMVLG